MRAYLSLIGLCVATLGLAFWTAAQERSVNAVTKPADGSASATPASPSPSANHPAPPPHTDLPLRLEGERRFRANCGRCHNAPAKYPPRVMATIIRHMRVRATLTDEDMRYILAYMTQ